LLLAVIVLGAVEDEGTFWIQLLMLVMLAAGAGAYLMFKSRVKRIDRRAHDEAIEDIIKPSAVSVFEPAKAVSGPKPSAKKKDTLAGMELLERNFLVSVVERTDSPDQRDIEMRRLCFTELTRRKELWSIASAALKVYTLDEDGFYGKVIRCEAMAELAGRTVKESSKAGEIFGISPSGSEAVSSAAHHSV